MYINFDEQNFIIAKKDQVFVCEECGKVFFRNDLLKNHMRVHTGDKPFTCEVCGESFRESGHLRRHMTRHTGNVKQEYPNLNLCCGHLID